MFRRNIVACARKFQVAVIGSGPSGCYVAQQLLKQNDGSTNALDIHVDVYEKLPVAYGLARFGVAPDHPEVKNVQKTFGPMFTGVKEEKTKAPIIGTQPPRDADAIMNRKATWIGNVEFGKDAYLEHFTAAYDAVVMSTGAAEDDAALGIPGEQLDGVIGARTIVNWANTVPYPIANPAAAPYDVRNVKRAVIIGNGNVALDVARYLVANHKHFCPTDMNAAALKELMHSTLEDVAVTARRGPLQAAFTIKEFRELTQLSNVVVDSFDLKAAQDVLEVQKKAGTNIRPRKRVTELIHEYTPEGGKSDANWKRKCYFRFNLNPVMFLPQAGDSKSLGSVVFEKTVVDDATGKVVSLADRDGLEKLTPESTPSWETLEKYYLKVDCDLAVRSVGFRPKLLRDLPYKGHVLDSNNARVVGHPGVYTSGWIRTGPRGVIVDTLKDARNVANTILADLHVKASEDSSDKAQKLGKFPILDLLVEKKHIPIGYRQYERIEYSEKERGFDMGKAAEKVPDVKQMLEIAYGGERGREAHDHFRGISNKRPPGWEYHGFFFDDHTRLIDPDSVPAEPARAKPIDYTPPDREVEVRDVGEEELIKHQTDASKAEKPE